MAKAMSSCPICGSGKITTNQRHTVFCYKCHYCTTFKGNVERMPCHPLFDSHGYKIYRYDPDAKKAGPTQMLPVYRGRGLHMRDRMNGRTG